MASKTTSTDLVLSGIPTSAEILYAVENGQAIYIENEATEADILGRIAKATSIEEIFGGSGELKSPTSVLGTSLRVISVDGIRQSDPDKAGGLGVYLVITVVDPDGESFSMAVGSGDAIVKLLRLRELGALPRWVAFVESEKLTKNGRRPINLVDREDGGGF